MRKWGWGLLMRKWGWGLLMRILWRWIRSTNCDFTEGNDSRLSLIFFIKIPKPGLGDRFSELIIENCRVQVKLR